MYFVGRRGGGQYSKGVFAYDGARFEKVSTSYIDRYLTVGGIYPYVYPMTFYGQTALAIGLVSPGTASQYWLMFFPDHKEWFEWTSTVFSPVSDGVFLLGCGASDRNSIYQFSQNENWQDEQTAYAWFTQFKLPTRGTSRRFMHNFGVDADTARAANDLTVEFSDDDCQTFTTAATIDLTQDRKVAFRGGMFRNRHVRLGNTNDQPTRLSKFIANVT
jgi:hypothetical protein